MWFRSHFCIFTVFLNLSFVAAQNTDRLVSLGQNSTDSLGKTPDLQVTGFKGADDTLNTKHSLDIGPSGSGSLSDSLLEIALTFKGTPYRMGGRSGKGFDCSGFVHYLYDKFDIELGYSCPGIAQSCEKIKKDELQKGDLIFFKGRNIRTRTPGHVSIVYDVDSVGTVHMIHATQRGVVLDNLNKSSYYKPRLLFYARVKR